MKLIAESTVFNDEKVQNKFSELVVDADGIRTEVGKKVGNTEVISRINQSAESVKIQADKINIDGVITAVNDNTTTTIDGDKITTGTLLASAVKADSGTFNTANIPNLSSEKITVGSSSLTNALDGKAASGAENTANNYITDIGNDGIRVHDSHTSNNAIVINSNGMEVFKGGTTDEYSVAKYGDTARIGKAASNHISLDATNGMQVFTDTESDSTNVAKFSDTARIGKLSTRHVEVKDGGMQVLQDSSTVMAHIGYGSGNAMSGTATAPYYTFGTRTSGSSVGNYSVAEGYNNTASGYSSHAEGQTTVASGTDSHAEGYGTTASGTNSHAEGSGNTASGAVSHAEGKDTTASGQYSHAEGYGTIAAGTGQTAIGIFNVSDSTSLFIIGKGNSSTRANAFSVASNGTVYVNGTSVHSSDRRLKEHIAYLGDEAVEFINNLKPAHYIKDDAKHVGFYAQDVAEVDKWDCMIGEEMNGYMTLGYMELLAPLVAYVQRLEKRIEELERSR